MSENATAAKLEMLKTSEQVQAYLGSISDSSFPEEYRLPSSIVSLTTGGANGIHRLTFTPHQSPNIPATAILKHATPYVFEIDGQTVVWDLWPFELNALRDVPSTETVKPPKVYWVDEANHVMIM